MTDEQFIAESHTPRQERLLIFVAAIEERHGFGCRVCDRALCRGFSAIWVSATGTPGVSGQLHFVCDADCGKKLHSEFERIGVAAKQWTGPQVREWLNHPELAAGVIGVRQGSTPGGAFFQYCSPFVEHRR